ncbi:LuxR C-terminal-related transcriptional regulator [Micromonospora sp. C28SCA-DRY-2]|uniref:helix-turn-helix transcriptional regulator n=1 Tax=Micromonospora sp. C28SCA-DRY-2 TaxID=3059522 RepID=UPI0026762D9C|nr:LuxR family transcriptional regulator [Micromonospora sp. C28SCA-DRY-2]MDO3704669.1 LuxR C-terminal-related transcriptional regulator [Micromonospora sp. C28SCA-DRY-2]
MSGAAVGRDVLVDRARRSLDEGRPVLVEGPAGIGKTVVHRELLAAARGAGWLVLGCAPTEAESALPFAALADLLAPLADRVPELPAPQRAALAGVLLTGDEPGQPIDDRTVGAATRSLLEVAADGPAPRLLVAVDDAPWLDPPSERALRFAVRRLVPRIAVLVTARADRAGGDPAPLGLDHGAGGTRLDRIGLGPLGVGALHHVLRTETGTALPRPLLVRIAAEAGGNPLLAIELARAVLRLPQLPAPGADLPAAPSLRQLVAGRVAALPPDTRHAVRLAALSGVPTLAGLARAGVPPAAFDAAEEAGLVAVRGDAVGFAHPVYAAAVRADVPPGVRGRLHRLLADTTLDPDERARQLAGCVTGPDGSAAAEVAAAAARQRARGAPETAAGLYDGAVRLTPPGTAEQARWRLAAAECRFDSGDYPAARVAAERAAEELTGPDRAEALLLRAIIAWSSDEPVETAWAAGERALASAPAGSPLAGRIHAHLSLFRDAPDPARRHAEAAIALLADRPDDRPVYAAALALLFFNEVRAGLPARTGLLERALELEGEEPSWLAGTVPAIWWRSVDEHGRARDRLHDMLARAVARGDEPSQHELLTQLGDTELLAGRWTDAAAHIAAARELGEQYGTDSAAEHWLDGMLLAYRGWLAEADRIAADGLRRAAELDDRWRRRLYAQLAGFVALSAGRMPEAARHYGELAVTVDELGLVEPIAQRFEPDWLEACVGAGELATAEAALDRLAIRHRRLPRPWTTLGLARCRVLLAGALGRDPSDALAELAAARAAVPADVLPLDRARCLLVAGVAYRRLRRRRDAREALTAAAAEFDALGAAALAARARAEADRTGGRPPAPRQLTGTELEVARLAAAGRTNRVIADTLFISPKTVEANLARVYRKLGVASRAELGAVMARADVEG